MYKLLKYENWWGHKKRVYWIYNHIQGLNECLDVGCGTGAYLTIPLNLYSQKTHNTVKIKGMDLAEESIKIAKKNALLYGIPEEWFSQGNICECNTVYDAIICSEVLEHISDDMLEGFVKGLCKAVKSDGGKVVITVPNGKGSFERGKKFRKTKMGMKIFPNIERICQIVNIHFFKRWMYYDEINNKCDEDEVLNSMTASMTEHVQFFSKQAVCELFERQGMKLVDFSGSNLWAGVWINLLPLFQPLTNINDWLGKVFAPYASGYYFVFEKQGDDYDKVTYST